MTSFINEITEYNIENFITNSEKKPLVVYFSAPWCGPCRMAKPALESLAKKYEDKITIGKVDAEDEPLLSHKYRVSSVPTFFIFENKKIIHQSTGLQILSVLRNKYNLN